MKPELYDKNETRKYDKNGWMDPTLAAGSPQREFRLENRMAQACTMIRSQLMVNAGKWQVFRRVGEDPVRIKRLWRCPGARHGTNCRDMSHWRGKETFYEVVGDCACPDLPLCRWNARHCTDVMQRDAVYKGGFGTLNFEWGWRGKQWVWDLAICRVVNGRCAADLVGHPHDILWPLAAGTMANWLVFQIFPVQEDWRQGVGVGVGGSGVGEICFLRRGSGVVLQFGKSGG